MRLSNFYEVMDQRGDLIWGGENVHECVSFFRKFIDSSVYASVWNTESEEDFRIVNDRIEITDLLKALLVSEEDKK